MPQPAPTPWTGRIRDRARLVRELSGFRGSANYWERRYAAGGTSGAGSYGEVAAYKAGVLNGFAAEHKVASVVEFGCGDGNQLGLADYPRYLGLDVSRTAIERCTDRFEGDETKSFMWYDPSRFVNHGAIAAEVALSLDVLLHLVEDEVFATYLRVLFGAATRFVIIFSSDMEARPAAHVRQRRFTGWVAANVPGWRLSERIENPLVLTAAQTSADFYVYEPA